MQGGKEKKGRQVKKMKVILFFIMGNKYLQEVQIAINNFIIHHRQ